MNYRVSAAQLVCARHLPAACFVALQALQSVASAFLETEELPSELRPAIVQHMMLVHQSVRQFSTQFAEELRRHNYVTVRPCAVHVHAPVLYAATVCEITDSRHSCHLLQRVLMLLMGKALHPGQGITEH